MSETPNTKRNIVGLVTTVATAVLAIWAGPTVDLNTPVATKVAQSLVVGCALALNVYRMNQVRHIFLASFTLVGTLLTFIAMKLPAGSAAAGLVPTVIAILTNINTSFSQQEATERIPMKTTLILALLTLSTLAYAGHVRAEPLTDAAPWAGKCFGEGTSTCLVPELSFDVGRVRLTGPDAGKLEAGMVPIGAGYALLFGYDQWWASGPSVHAILDLSQLGANTFQVSTAATIFRYFHVGTTYARVGGAGEWYGIAGLTAPIDLVTGAVATKRADAVRATRAAAAAGTP